MDFGIAKDATTPALTREGNFIGTVQYLAPEQLAGTTTGDQSSDIWALGILLYEIVTGHLPFETETVTDCFRRINVVSYPPPETFNPALPQEVRSLIYRCLKKNPTQRYATAADFLQDVERLTAVASAPTPRLRKTTRNWTWGCDMQKWIAVVHDQWVLWVAGIALLALITMGVFMTRPPREFRQGFRDSQGGLPPPNPKNASVLSPSDNSAPQQALVHIDTLAGSADVYQNGSRIDRTPWRLNAPVGSHIDRKSVV